MQSDENWLVAWGKYLKWRLWDSWHGTSVSAFDEHRTSQNEAPGLDLGFFKITWALLVRVGAVLLGLAAVVGLGFLLSRIDWQKLPPGLLNVLVQFALILVPTILVFVAGFIAGYMFKSARNEGGK